MEQELEKLSRNDLIAQIKLQGSVLAKQQVKIGQLTSQYMQAEVIAESSTQEAQFLEKENKRLLGVIAGLKETNCNCEEEEEIPESYHDI